MCQIISVLIAFQRPSLRYGQPNKLFRRERYFIGIIIEKEFFFATAFKFDEYLRYCIEQALGQRSDSRTRYFLFFFHGANVCRINLLCKFWIRNIPTTFIATAVFEQLPACFIFFFLAVHADCFFGEP